MTPNPSNCRLLQTANGDLKIVTQPLWTKFDHEVWDTYEEMAENNNYIYPKQVAIGRYKNHTVLYARTLTDSTGDEENGLHYDEESEYDSTINIYTYVMIYKTPDSEIYELLFSNDIILEGDGSYNILKDTLPIDYVDEIIFSKFPKISKNGLSSEEKEKLEAFLSENDVSIDQIKDMQVRLHCENLLN